MLPTNHCSLGEVVEQRSLHLSQAHTVTETHKRKHCPQRHKPAGSFHLRLNLSPIPFCHDIIKGNLSSAALPCKLNVSRCCVDGWT